MLGRLVDSGVLGLTSYLLMIVSIMLAARPLIRARNATTSPPALAVGAAAVAYLVVSFLFDVLSFPHTPYILLSLAGLLAVLVVPPDEPAPTAGHAPGRPRARRAPKPPLRRPGDRRPVARPTHH